MNLELFDESNIQKLVSVGKYPELNTEEIEALCEHHKGNQSALLRENFFVHKKKLTITKTIDEDVDLPMFVKNILDNCFLPEYQVFLGKIKGFYTLTNMILDFHGFFLTKDNEYVFQFGSRNSGILEPEQRLVVDKKTKTALIQHLEDLMPDVLGTWFTKRNALMHNAFSESEFRPSHVVSALVIVEPVYHY